jgi:hypothetical protein
MGSQGALLAAFAAGMAVEFFFIFWADLSVWARDWLSETDNEEIVLSALSFVLLFLIWGGAFSYLGITILGALGVPKWHAVVLVYGLIFAFAPGIYLKSSLPAVDEQALLSHSVTFGFAMLYAIASGRSNAANQLLWDLLEMLLVFGLPVTIGLAYVVRPLVAAASSRRVRLYLWHVFVSACFGLLQLEYGDLGFFMGKAAPAASQLFFSGMAFYYVVGNLLVFPDLAYRYWNGSLSSWSEACETIGGKFAESRVGMPALLGSVATQAAVLAANAIHPVLPQPLLLNVSFLFLPQLLRWRLQSSLKATGASGSAAAAPASR